MLNNNSPRLKLILLAGMTLAGCGSTRQLAIDHPTSESAETKAGLITKTQQFQALPSFQAIDGDDYYVRLISEFEFKDVNALKFSCSALSPTFKKEDRSSALIFNVRNSRLKFSNEAAGYSYQTSEDNCKVKFDAKKLYLTPWMRLDLGRETQVDYSVYSSANSNVDVAGLVNKVTAASSLLAFTGVGMGVAVLGQVAGQWYNQQHAQTPPQPTPAANHSTESHTLPTFVKYSDKSGTLVETLFKVNAVAEGGVNILGSDSKPVGELKVTPEITVSLLLKTKPDGLPDARDLSLVEINQSPIKSASGEINLQQLIEQSKHPEKPNLKPNWANYDDVQTHCRKLKIVLKDLGFNKFDRNAYLYYFLSQSNDWKNYTISSKKVQAEEMNAQALQNYRRNDFSNCLADTDFTAMKAMGLPVNSEADWLQISDASQKKEQQFMPLKSIERQLLAVLKNPNKAELENQIYPLISTSKKGEGTVLLQNRLGNFGLEKLLQPIATNPASQFLNNENKAISDKPALVNNKSVPTSVITLSPTAATTTPIPGEGLIINARELVQVLTGMGFNELSCGRLIPEQLGNPNANTGILLFTTREGSPRAKGGAMEFEFANGKINRIAFQSPSYRDFEQNVMDHPHVGGCRIAPEFLGKLH